MDHLIVRDSFKITFHDAELWAANFDSLGDHYELIKKKFLEDIAVLKRPSSPSQVLLNLHQTDVTNELAHFLIDNFESAQPYLKKVVFSGLCYRAKRELQKYIFKKQPGLQFAVNFIDDVEKAKEWLL